MKIAIPVAALAFSLLLTSLAPAGTVNIPEDKPAIVEQPGSGACWGRTASLTNRTALDTQNSGEPPKKRRNGAELKAKNIDIMYNITDCT